MFSPGQGIIYSLIPQNGGAPVIKKQAIDDGSIFSKATGELNSPA
jgi:hypothetical protein